MVKKIEDIKFDPEKSRINLKGKNKEKNHKKDAEILQKQYRFKKKSTPINEVRDLKGESLTYNYIKGKKFILPKRLDNLIKIAVVGFIIIFLINTINVYVKGKKIEAEVSSNAKDAFNHLILGGKSTSKIEFESALESFNKAQNIFEQSNKDLWFINQDQTFYANKNDVTNAITALIDGGKHFSLAGKSFLQAVEDFNKIPLYFFSRNEKGSSKNPSITDVLKTGLVKTDEAIKEIDIAIEKINKVNENVIPKNIRAKIIFAKQKVNEISKILTSTSKHFPSLLKLLGDRYPHRYLILLQNNDEIRPSGGFIGSYAIMDINDGYIEKLDIHDSYDIDGSYGGVIEPPDEFKAFSSNWRFRDSNYSSDFEVSGKKARWFLETEGGPTVDTVIALNQGLLKDLMEITGPVKVGDFGELTSENYNLLLSYVIEGKVWGDKDPKHILKVFIPAFKDALMREENISKVMSKLYKAVQQKHIMIYSSDEQIQEFIIAIGISGKTAEIGDKDDYLSVINIATGGTKSEKFMQENIVHDTVIDKNGGITNTLKITRSHLWSDSIYIKWKKIINSYGFEKIPDNLIDILGRGANKVSVRIYVPEGSVLIDSNNKEVDTKYDKDLKKTYFFTTMETTAGEINTMDIKYKLPFHMDMNPASTYKLIIEKQPGSRGSIFTKTLEKDESINTVDQYPKDVKIDSNGYLRYDTDLVYDRYFSTLITK